MQSIIFFPRQQLSFLFTNYMVKGVFLGFKYRQDKQFQDFPGGAVVKNLPANAGDTGSSPGPGRSHMPRSN